jgi:TonB family protein
MKIQTIALPAMLFLCSCVSELKPLAQAPPDVTIPAVDLQALLRSQWESEYRLICCDPTAVYGRVLPMKPIVTTDRLFGFPKSEFETVPQPRIQPGPVYPVAMLKAGMEGSAVIAFVIGSDGSVKNAVALEASDRSFASSAIKGVYKWEFTPGTRKGRVADCALIVPIIFSINRSPSDDEKVIQDLLRAINGAR